MAEPAKSLEAFTADLNREALALGLTPQNYLVAVREPQATYRAQMLPYAEYDDGSAGFSYPQIVPDTWAAMQKMGRAAQSAFGVPYAPEDVMPTAQDAGLIAGLAMTGGLGTGLAGRSARAVSGRAPAQVETSRLLPSHSVEAGSEPLTARVYRGTGYPSQERTHPGPYYASDNPEVSATYAQNGPAPATFPGDMTLNNPMVIDAAGAPYNRLPGAHKSVMKAADFARKSGNDGLVVRNVLDLVSDAESGPMGTTYVAFNRGSVKSPFTGETLFSNAPETAPAGLLDMSLEARMARARAMGFDTESPWYHGSKSDFDAFDMSKLRTTEGDNAFYFTRNKDEAGRYAKDGQVYPVYLRNRDPLIEERRWRPYDATNGRFLTQAQESGKDAVIIRSPVDGDIAMKWNPSDIRSVNAAFDPARADSTNLLASNPSSPVGLLPMAGGDANFEADLRRQAIALGIIEGLPLESVQGAPVNNYLEMAKAEHDAARPNLGKLRMTPRPPTPEEEMDRFDRQMRGLPPLRPIDAPPPAPGNQISAW